MSNTVPDIFNYRPAYLPDFDFGIVPNDPVQELIVSDRTERIGDDGSVRVVLNDPNVIQILA